MLRKQETRNKLFKCFVLKLVDNVLILLANVYEAFRLLPVFELLFFFIWFWYFRGVDDETFDLVHSLHILDEHFKFFRCLN